MGSDDADILKNAASRETENASRDTRTIFIDCMSRRQDRTGAQQNSRNELPAIRNSGKRPMRYFDLGHSRYFAIQCLFGAQSTARPSYGPRLSFQYVPE